MSLLTGLVSYWALNEASGSAIDSHGSNPLTENGTGGVASVAGKVNGARRFVPGEMDYFSHADNADLSTGDIDFTFAMWVYFEDLSVYRYFLGKWTASQCEYALGYYPTAGIRFSLSANGTTQTDIAAGPVTPSLNTWYYAVVWHDSTANTINIQVDNGTVASAPFSSSGVFNSTSDFNLGRLGGTSGSEFPHSGYLDEVGFWKRILTADERTQLYNGNAGKPYWDFAGNRTYEVGASTKLLNYSSPINWKHPLNRGLASRWQALPWWIGSYTFPDLCGGAYKKESINKANGTLTYMEVPSANDDGWYPTTRRGGFGEIRFAGYGSVVDMGNHFGFLKTDIFSGTAWARATDSSLSMQTIFGKMAATFPFQGWTFGFLNTAESSGTSLALLVLENDDVGIDVRTATDTIGSDVWYHVAFTYSGSGTAAGVKLYINGELQTPTVEHDNLVSDIGNSTGFCIGGQDPSSATRRLAGAADDIRIYYNRILTDTEVKQIYRTSQQRYDPTLNWTRPTIYSPVPSGVAARVWEVGTQMTDGGVPGRIWEVGPLG